MKVILQRDIPNVGKNGEMVSVADGYARNYLFPRSYAVAATGGALREHTARATREKERTAGRLASAQAEAGKLEGITITIVAKAGAGSTKLFGSVTAQDVADAIEKGTGVAVDKRRVGLADPIKALGDYRIPVRLHNDVTVMVPVSVATEEELERRKAEAARAEAARLAAEAAHVAAAPAESAADETPAEADTGEAAEGAEEQSSGEAAD